MASEVYYSEGTLVTDSGIKIPTGGVATTAPIVILPTPSGDTSGATDAAAINALFNSATLGTIFLLRQGTYYVNATLRMPGGCQLLGGSLYGTTVKAAAASGIAAVIAAAGYVTNQTSSDFPVTIAEMTVDGNSTAVRGIVTMNYRSLISRNQVTGTTSHGIVVSDCSANGTAITNTAVENIIAENWVLTVGGHGIFVPKTSGLAKSTDYHIRHNRIGYTTLDGIHADTCSGVHISSNHTYSTQTAGIYCSGPYASVINNNYIEGFGLAGGDQAGLWLANVPSGRESIVEGNHVSAVEVTGQHYEYFYTAAAGSTTCAIQFRNNVANKDSGTATSSHGFEFNAPTGSVLTVRGGGTNVNNGPATAHTASGAGTVTMSADNSTIPS